MWENSPLAGAMIAMCFSGLLGATGQGVRVVAGLKQLAENAASANSGQIAVFTAARLTVSLLIGFVVGTVAGIPFGLDKNSPVRVFPIVRHASGLWRQVIQVRIS